MAPALIGKLIVAVAAASQIACGVASSALQAPPETQRGFFENADARLSYRLDFPASGAAPYPAVVMGHGSGRMSKDDFDFLAVRMRQRGYAVLRYDKRGVGESTGEYTGIGPGNSERMMPLLASDMAAGVRLLRTLPAIDGRRVGLMGMSQAGWIIPAAAAGIDVAFFIILSGPTVTVGQEIYYSDFAEKSDRPFDELSKILATFKGRHGFDPVPVLQRVTAPGLWLLGSMDRSIPTRESVEILERLKAEGRPFTLRLYPTGTHALTDSSTGAFLDIWPDIDRWLNAQR